MSIDADLANELASEGGGPWFKFENVGDKITLRISGIKKQQQTEFGTGKPLFWDDGNPRIQYEIKGTDTGTGEETRIFAKAGMLRAIKGAFTAAGTKPEVDGVLTVKRLEDGAPSKPGLNAPHEFAAKYTPPAPVADIDDL